MFLLLSGCGVGYSVQSAHIEKLPPINKPIQKPEKKYLIGDSIERLGRCYKGIAQELFQTKFTKNTF